MANPGYFHFSHSYLSRNGNQYRGKSGPGHLAAVGNYITNARKANRALSINLPSDRREFIRALHRHDRTVTRANGRIAETFIVCFDKRMSLEDQDEAISRFARRVTFDGRTKARIEPHDDNPDNPHAHVLLIDTDDNGRPVGFFGRSGSFRRENSPVKGNPTEWLRKVWEDECNAVLEERGYDFRVDRRTNLARGLDKAGEHQGPKPIPEMEMVSEIPQQELKAPAVDERPPMPVVEEEPAVEPADPETPSEDDMSEVAEMPMRDRVGYATDLYENLQYLHRTVERLKYAEAALASSTEGYEKAQAGTGESIQAKSTAERKLETARQNLAQFQKANGRLKGFEVPILGWKTKTRQQGEQAALTYSGCETALEYATRDYEEAQGKVQHWESVVAANAQRVQQSRDELAKLEATMGDGKDLEVAEKSMTNAMHQSMEGVGTKDLKQMMQDGEITESEYETSLRILDTTEARVALQELEDEVEKDRSESR